MGDVIFEMKRTLRLLSGGVSKMEIYHKEGKTWEGHMGDVIFEMEGPPQPTIRWSKQDGDLPQGR